MRHDIDLSNYQIPEDGGIYSSCTICNSSIGSRTSSDSHSPASTHYSFSSGSSSTNDHYASKSKHDDVQPGSIHEILDSSQVEPTTDKATVPSACIHCRAMHLKCDRLSPCIRCSNRFDCICVRARRGFKGPRRAKAQSEAPLLNETVARAFPIGKSIRCKRSVHQ